MSRRILLVAPIILLILPGCSKKQTPGAVTPTVNVSPVTAVSPRPGRSADFSWTDRDGRTVDLDTYGGRVTVVNFWATWCPPCRAELPDLISLSKEMAAKGVRFIGVSVDRGANVAADLREFARANGIPYPIVISNRELEEAYGSISAIPTTFIVDSSGAITRTFVGSRTKEVFAQAIDAALR